MHEILAYRLKYKGQGIFQNTHTEILRRLAKLTPEWKSSYIDDPDLGNIETIGLYKTFIGYYASLDAPDFYERSLFRLEQSRIYKQSIVRYGFVSKEVMVKQFGLFNALYAKQFRLSLDTIPDFKVVVYLAKPSLVCSTEVIFDITKSEVIEIANNYDEFIKL